MSAKRRIDDEKARLLERLRVEVAAELGINVTESGNFGDVPTALCGKMGAIVRDRAEQLLKNQHVPKN
jgi:hypothetical protein